jgi:hypothetical protein
MDARITHARGKVGTELFVRESFFVTAKASLHPGTQTAVAWDAAGNQTTSTARTVTVSHPRITLAWDANTETNIAGYRVYFGTSAGMYSDNVDVGSLTSYTVSGLQPGTRYYFAVTAYNSNGNESGSRTRSAWSTDAWLKCDGCVGSFRAIQQQRPGGNTRQRFPA